MVLPSKELLSAVLGVDVYEDIFYASDDIRTTFINGNNLVYSTSNAKFTGNNINIYELMHMMKEWAIDKKYWLDSGLDENKKGIFTLVNFKHQEVFEDNMSETEFEAVTKACEWVLEQQK